MARRIIGLIPARYGSTRFPGKPLATIGNKTLIQRTYESGKKCTLLKDLIVATDDQRIFQHVNDFGGKAMMTSSYCMSGTERITEVIRETQFYNDDVIINIQGDEPFIESSVIEKVAECLLQDPDLVMSTAIVSIPHKEEAINPSIVKCIIDQQGYALYFSRNLIPSGKSAIYFKHLGIYGYRRDFLLRLAKLPPTPLQQAEDLEQLKVLEHGYRIKATLVESKSVGVDTPEDLKKVERLL